MTASLLGFLAVFAMMALRVPIAMAMGVVGFAGLALLRNWDVSVVSTLLVIKSTGFSYTLSVIPLFLLMGNIAARAGMATELFELARAFLGHRRGGIAMATVGASGGFGAICGSSIATTATITKVAYPEMRRLDYSPALIAGTVAAGGTLGILIPPSTLLIIYGILTETNIGKLFAAGFLPGLLTVFCLCLMVGWRCRRDPSAAPTSERYDWRRRWRAFGKVWGVVVLFVLVIGGIYGGLFTATEGAGFGAFGTLVLALARRRIGWSGVSGAVADATRTTAMLFAILMGALIFGNFINFTGMPGQLQSFVSGLAVSPTVVVLAICAIYILLGSVMEELSMVMLTVPLFFPVIVGLGLDPYWFGIVIVMVVMIGMISPPVGMNLFVLSSLVPELPVSTVYRGVLPFMGALVLALLLVILFPDIATFLPQWTK
ncbi:TRAP transporter large permease [Alloalcanivorax sp. C16-1]|uniref:TRAP transporter large permease n=1 Tax=Alloalcanivorax sp. C16-1 TaxID=3390051 RepID=UPI003970DCAC